MNSDVDVKFLVRAHATNGEEYDFSDSIVDCDRTKPMDGGSVGQWKINLKIPWDRSGALRGIIRGTDRSEMTFRGHGESSPMLGAVDRVTYRHMADPQTGLDTVVWSLQGRDWTRFLTDTDVRIGAYMSYSTVDWESSRAVKKDKGFIVGPGDERTDEEILAIGEDSLELEREFVRQTKTLPRMPGIIAELQWSDFLAAAYESSSGPRADVPLRKIMKLMLWGLWLDPNPARGTINKLLSWSRFGERFDEGRGVPGIPWKLQHIATQGTLTPWKLLEQYGNPAWTELFTEYDSSRMKPAIVYRERPYSNAAFNKIPIHDLAPSTIESFDLTRADDERFTYWRPIAPMAGIHGADQLLDTADGYLPIIDINSMSRYGFRAAEPEDTFEPPMAAAAKPTLQWHIDRIKMFWRWYVNNPEYVSGTLDVIPAVPQLRIGERVRIPMEWTFKYPRVAKPVEVQSFAGYIVALSDWARPDPESGEMVTGTTVTIIRGQPEGGLPLPPMTSWRR